jgi:hypothetical protein
MYKNNYRISVPAADLRQALIDITDSTALSNKALSRILDAEGKILDRAKNEVSDTASLEKINMSVKSIIKSAAMIRLINSYELEESENLLMIIEGLCDYDETEE